VVHEIHVPEIQSHVTQIQSYMQQNSSPMYHKYQVMYHKFSYLAGLQDRGEANLQHEEFQTE
jgi:hypothetical protein